MGTRGYRNKRNKLEGFNHVPGEGKTLKEFLYYDLLQVSTSLNSVKYPSRNPSTELKQGTY
jgi:hypothetical protein